MPLTFSHLIPHCVNRLHRAPLPPRIWTSCPPGISISTLNIRDGWGFGLVQDIRVMERGGFGVMILTKTKISTTVYCWNRLGFEVTCLTTQPTRNGGDQGSIGIVTRERSIGWGIDSTRYHEPNVVRWELVTELIRTPLFYAYLPPSTLEHLPDLEESLKRFK